MPIIHSLYRKPFTFSTAVLRALNSDPNVDVSILPCFFVNHSIGARLTYNNIPVRERHVIESPAWSASTNPMVCTALPLGSGALEGISSFASG
jgi:hypothetical protein